MLLSNNQNIIEYLPEYVRNFDEIEKLLNSEQGEINQIWIEFNKLFNNQFIETADESGVERFEQMLHIEPSPLDTLEERKYNILSVYNEQIPYTYNSMLILLATICDKYGFNVKPNFNNYEITINIELKSKGKQSVVKKTLRRVIPANIVININLIYNSHFKVAKYAHLSLKQLTHINIRSEVLP